MAEAKLYGQNQGGGLKLNGTIKEVYAEENVAKGDLLEYIGNKVRKTRTNQFVGVAKTGGIAGTLVSMWTKVTVEPQDRYIANGLIAHFSGEDDYNNGAWLDRVSGYKFTPLASSTQPKYDATNKLYNQDTFGGMVSDFTIPAGSDFTFEVVTRDIYDATSSNMSSYYATIVGSAMNGWNIYSGGIALQRTPENKIVCSIPGNGISPSIARSTLTDGALDTFTIIPSVGVYHNGVKISNINANSTERKIGLFSHYSGSYTSYYKAKAKIHSVRVYNRQLTPEEVAQNHTEDVRIYGE